MIKREGRENFELSNNPTVRGDRLSAAVYNPVVSAGPAHPPWRHPSADLEPSSPELVLVGGGGTGFFGGGGCPHEDGGCTSPGYEGLFVKGATGFQQ